MKFISTRGGDGEVSFKDAVFKGLARDGGLFIPVSHPDLSALFNSFSGDTPFIDIAARTISALFPDELSPSAAERVCKRAFTFSPQLISFDEQISILELFHGPSCAFKDFGASFLASVMEEFLQGSDSRAIILTATSGDTGSAVARAFYGKKNIDVVILYPSGRVSPLQEKQLTTLGENVSALEVLGSFDDCQRMVKEAFVDQELNRRLPLTSANSINLGRLIPQALYYVYAAAQSGGANLHFCVPSGNFGNLTAGLYAWKWGMDTGGFIAATNANDVVPDFLSSGDYKPRPSIHTLSNAMDVGAPSNFERMAALFGGDYRAMSAHITGIAVSDDETLQTMRNIHQATRIFLDPHTAVGYCAAKKYLAGGDASARVVALATAHPGKFTEVVERATKTPPDLPRRLAKVLDLEKKSTVVESSTGDLADYLQRRFW